MSLPFEQKPVYVFSDSPFATLVAVADDYQTLRFKRGWYSPGDFELTINKNTLYASQFVKGRIIRVGDDNTKVGYIDDITNNVGPEGALSEIISVRGHELTQWLDRRDILPPTGDAYYELPNATPAETVVKDIIRDNLGSGAAVARQDTDLTVATDLGRGSNYKLSSRYNNLLKEVSDCLLATNSGIYVTLSPTTNKWTIEYSVGTDRTATVVFSTDRETTLRASLRDADIAYKNVATVAGQGEGADRTIRTVWDGSEPTGRARREMFVDARDLTLTASLDARGAQKLAENQFEQYLKVDALAYSQVKYGVDYFVGDKVTVSQFGVTQQVYITSAEESWRPGDYGLSLGFDRSPPTLTGQVSGIAGTAVQTLARIDPTVASSVIYAYIDDRTVDYPTASNLFEAHGFDGIPDITYPNNVAGIYYQPNFAGGLDGWAEGHTAGSAGTITNPSNLLDFVVGSSGGGSSFITKASGLSIPTATAKVVIFRVKRVSGSDTLLSLRTTGGNVIGSGTYTVATGVWEYVAISSLDPTYWTGTITGLRLLFRNAVSGGEWQIDTKGIYIGDGSYTWTVGDDSGNGRTLTPHGALSVGVGREGKSLVPDGATGYASGTLSGFTDTIHIHRFATLQIFTATQKMLWESSTDSSATTGAIRLVTQLVTATNRVLVRVKTATGTLGGYTTLSSIGDHWFDVLYDRTVTSDSALRLFVDGLEVTLTYDFPYSGAGTLPAVYNGDFYVGARGGTSLFSKDAIDEHMVRTTLPNAEQIHALYRLPMQEASDQTGSGSHVRATEPTISGAIPIMESVTQTVNKTIPSGYNAIVYGAYEIGALNSLTVNGTFVIL